MSSPGCKLSIVCPAYEEEAVLPRFHHELCAVLAALDKDYEIEIIYVDDGSHDGTLDLLRKMAADDSRVRYLSLSRNFGHQAALTAGLEHAQGDVIISLDSDLQHPPGLIPVLLEKWKQGHDIVLTLREDDPRLGWFKRSSSRGFYTLMRLLSDTEVRAAASDFRLLARPAVDALLRMHESHRFLRGMVNWLGFRATTVSFAPANRGGGVSKYTFHRMLNFAFDGLLSFSKLPVRLPLFLGAFFLLCGTLYGIYALLHTAFARASAPGGWSAVLTAVLLVGGCILCALGIVGEYVGRVYEQVKGRPIYLLKESSPELLARSDGLDASAPVPYRARQANAHNTEPQRRVG
jgi:dolichol-phosphate mannosyltransferase